MTPLASEPRHSVEALSFLLSGARPRRIGGGDLPVPVTICLRDHPSKNWTPALSCAITTASRRMGDAIGRLRSLLRLAETYGDLGPNGGLTDEQERRACSKYHSGAALER
jgi:hypothetical protein